MPVKPFLLYRSSAGSGKTFKLAFEYLKLALSTPKGYRNILGVTFTNKATEEMKRRIIDVLQVLASGEEHPMRGDLKDELGIDSSELQRRSDALLTRLLHDYSRFAVVTIDSFFHSVIRSFAREMGLQGSFGIILDTRKVMDEVVDNLLADLGDEDQALVRAWLTKFATTNVEDGKPWDFRRDIASLAGEILKDQFKEHKAGILQMSEEPGFFEDFLQRLDTRKTEIEQHWKAMARRGIALVDQAGGPEVFKGKSRSPAFLFNSFVEGKFDINATQIKAVGTLSNWLGKSEMGSTQLVHQTEELILPLYDALVADRDAKILEYCSITEVQRYFFTFGILAEIHKKLQAYREENDAMLIADFPDFLRLIIADSDTPYIYEKVGSMFQHYLIDEFQDTSSFQWHNFKALVKNATDAGQLSMVVGDVKQSIYRWRGGDWKMLHSQVVEDIGAPLVDERVLTTNWRSDRKLVAFNNAFFSDLEAATHKYLGDLEEQNTSFLQETLGAYKDAEQLSSDQSDQGFVHVRCFEGDETAGTWKEQAIAETINKVEALQGDGYALRDIAILTRSLSEGKEISDAFFAHKDSEKADPTLSYDVVSSEALYLYSSHAVKFVIALIKWLKHDEDDIALAEWVYEYQRFIAQNEQRSDATIFRSRESWQKQVPSRFVKERPNLKRLPLTELVDRIIDIFELNKIEDEFTYIQGFQDAVLDYAKNERGDIATFLDWWESVRKERAILIADQNNAVKILTIHKAKGLEFPVVIVPFMSWKLDHDSFSSPEILWCKPPEGNSLFRELPVVPLRYASALKDTYWADNYWEEKIRAYLDNLNLLYVAFTRAIHGLYAFAENPRTDRLSNVGQLAVWRLKELGYWDEELCLYENGSLADAPDRDERHASEEYGLKTYEVQDWKKKVSIQMKGTQELSERVFTAQKWGTEFHQKLGKLKRLEDLPLLKDEQLKRELKLIVHNEAITPFFEDIQEVRIEEPILLPGGGYKRIDRLVKKNDEWLVIDFKTGDQKPKDREQVIEYLDVLRSMGYEPVKGFLIYLDPVEVLTVL